MILIEKGEVIYMKNETGIQQTIEAFRHRLNQQFKYVHQITVSEMVGQIIDIDEQEFGAEYPTWRGFLPKEYWGEVLNPKRLRRVWIGKAHTGERNGMLFSVRSI